MREMIERVKGVYIRPSGANIWRSLTFLSGLHAPSVLGGGGANRGRDAFNALFRKTFQPVKWRFSTSPTKHKLKNGAPSRSRKDVSDHHSVTEHPVGSPEARPTLKSTMNTMIRRLQAYEKLFLAN